MAFDFKPKFVSFDMNGTLIHYRQDEAIRTVLGERLPEEVADAFELAGEQIRFDECMSEWRPMHQVLEAALRRTMAKFGLEYRDGDASAVYEHIPTWTPYPGVTDALRRLAEAYPLVMLTNTDQAHAPSLVANLQAPVEVVITAEQAQAYKPRLRAFEYMLDKLGVAPDEIVHVSSSPQYDHRPAFDVGIRNKVYMDRGWEPDQPWLSYTRITDIAELPALFGLERP
jgi:2-haloacid dehalogenase